MFGRGELRVDRSFFLAALILLGFGLLALYSAAYQKSLTSGASYLGRQLAWVGLGVGVAVLLVVVDYHRWLQWAYPLYVANLVLLVLVLLMGVVRVGAQRWLSIGGMTIQPSEFAKLTTILALSRYLGSHPASEASFFKTALGAAVLLLLPMGLILREPNLGTSSVFVPVGLSMLIIWGLPLQVVGILAGLAATAAPFAWWFLADYQRSRLMVFLNPSLDPLGAGYTVIQSRVAMGSGGWWGKGWLAGTQNQLNFLPERHTDFIFSVVGEEWGFFGTTACLALFAFLFYRGFRLADQTHDPYGRLLMVGLPLPFMSYGGSWLMTCLIGVGIILSVAARRSL